MTSQTTTAAYLILMCALTGKSFATGLPGLNFPMVGGVSGQTIQLNIRAIGDPNISLARCQANVGYRDSSGHPIGSSRAVDLRPGQNTFLTLKFSQFV